MQTEKQAPAAKGSPVELVRGLLDGIRERADRTEKERCVPAETVAEFKETGLSRAFQAKRYGGMEWTPADFYSAVIEVAQVCPSTGWVLGVLAVHPFQFAQFPVEAQDELFGEDINTIVSSSYAPTGKAVRAPGGYRLSGRWSFSSACDHASWVVLGAIPSGEGTTRVEQKIFLVAPGDWRIDDDWFVMGLSGTGSKSIIVEDAFVPEHRTLGWVECCFGLGPGLAVNPGALFRVPFMSVFGACLVVPAIGAAKGAYAEFARQAKDRVRAMDRRPATEDPYLQLRLADAEAEINGAERRVLSDFREEMERVEAGEKIPFEDRARYRWHQIHAIDSSAKAVERLFAMAGGRVIYYKNPIQRFYRDILAARQHTANTRDTMASLMAQGALGLDAAEFLA